MILDHLDVAAAELESGTGWSVQPEGLCKDDRCVPFRDAADVNTPIDTPIDVAAVAERLGMPLVHDERHGLWALGPESGGRVLESAELPSIVLAGADGVPFDLATLRGQKVLIAAWASW